MTHKTLIIGSGGREHALAWAMSQASTVFVSPGNAGIAQEFECLAADGSVEGWVDMAKKLRPTLVVVGPEAPLVAGLSDQLRQAGFDVLGPSKMAAQLEASKLFMKQVATAAGVKTAGYAVCRTMDDISLALDERIAPFVLKADGLCGGKGVSIHNKKEEALAQAALLLGTDKASPLFGEASQTVIVEDFSEGSELSIIGLCNGDDAVIFPGARDHKQLLEGGEGPNTGGMGVFGPLSDGDIGIKNWQEKAQKEIFRPILQQMKRVGYPYTGFLYAGVMIKNSDWSLLEINVRFGDPEAQNILFGLGSQAGSFLLKTGIPRDSKAPFDAAIMEPTVTIVLAAEGYPAKPIIGDSIEVREFEDKNAKIFWAGVERGETDLLTSGGRVLAISARGDSLSDARSKCYKAADQIQFEHKILRRDIAIDSTL